MDSVVLEWLAKDLLPVGLVGAVIAFFLQNSGMEVLKRHLSVKVEEEKDRLRRETESILSTEKTELEKVLREFTHQFNTSLELGKARLDVSKNIASRILDSVVKIAAAAAECNAATGGAGNAGSNAEHDARVARFTAAEQRFKEAYFGQIVLLDQALFDECRKYTGCLRKVRVAAQGEDSSSLRLAAKAAHAAYRELTKTIRSRVAQLAHGGIPDVGAILSDEPSK
jgi:hypothetical protein